MLYEAGPGSSEFSFSSFLYLNLDEVAPNALSLGSSMIYVTCFVGIVAVETARLKVEDWLRLILIDWYDSRAVEGAVGISPSLAVGQVVAVYSLN